MMTEDQKKKYEASVNKQSYKSHDLGRKDSISIDASLELIEDAHSEGKKEGWNDAIDSVISSINEWGAQSITIDGLQKLRK